MYSPAERLDILIRISGAAMTASEYAKDGDVELAEDFLLLALRLAKSLLAEGNGTA